MTLDELVEAAGKAAIEKGWTDLTDNDFVAWAHSEVSEIFEAIRKNDIKTGLRYRADGKPEGVAAEVADVFILLAHFCHQNSIPLGFAVEEKLKFNATRPYRHGHSSWLTKK